MGRIVNGCFLKSFELLFQILNFLIGKRFFVSECIKIMFQFIV